MLLASYAGTRDGFNGLFNIVVRMRLRGSYSHNEIVFLPGDGVDDLMPDGTCDPDAAGALWCCSSTGTEPIPIWSARRAGRRGGVRMKRIVLDEHWDLVPLTENPRAAALWARENEGRLYDWQLVAGFLAWLIPQKANRVMCSESCAEMLGFEDAWRLDPCSLRAVMKHLQQMS